MLVETFGINVSGTMSLFMKRKTSYSGSMASGYLMTRHLKEVKFSTDNNIQIIGENTFQLTNNSYTDLNTNTHAL
jgi:hypothetical protein